jgi:ABC-type transport system substrate-binding protein
MPQRTCVTLSRRVQSGMIGTGAFRFKSGTPNTRVELVRFPAYWGSAAPLDGVVMTWYEGTAPQVLAAFLPASEGPMRVLGRDIIVHTMSAAPHDRYLYVAAWDEAPLRVVELEPRARPEVAS